MSTPAMPAAQLACLLQDTAAGTCADAATTSLLIRHGHFLHRHVFRRSITAGSSSYSGEPVAVIRWRAAIHALEHGSCPTRHPSRRSCGSPPASATIPIGVHLRPVLGRMDSSNIALVTAAITTANGS